MGTLTPLTLHFACLVFPCGVEKYGADEACPVLSAHILGHEAGHTAYSHPAHLAPAAGELHEGSNSSRNISTPSLETGEQRGSPGPHGEGFEAIETLADRSKGKQPERSSHRSSVLGESLDTKLVSNISASDVQFVISNQEPTPPTVEELRDRIIKQHRFLGQRYEPEAKVRKPHQNPPAVDKAIRARFKPTTPEEEQARLAALKINVDNVMQQSVVRGVVVLEKRESVWKPLAAEPPADRAGLVETLERAPPLPSAWLLPLDTSSHIAFGKAKSKKVFRLPEFEAMAGCSTCDAKGRVMCPLCRAAESDECFWCEGTGVRKHKTCDNCNGRKIHACLKCDARGTIDCKDCKGNGQVYVGAFAEVKFRTISLPSVQIKDLAVPGTGAPPATAEEVAQCCKVKMAHTIAELSRSQSNKPNPSVPVLARCVWHKSVKRIVSVWRPNNVIAPGQKKLGLLKRAERRLASDDGQVHRFLVQSDKSAPIVEITSAAAASAALASLSGPASPQGSTSGLNTPSTSHMPSTASVSHLQSLWRGSPQSEEAPSVISQANQQFPPAAPGANVVAAPVASA